MSSAKKSSTQPTKEKPVKKVESDDEEGDDVEMNDENKEQKETEDLANPDVVTKYKKAAEIANEAVALIMKSAKTGVTIVELCKLSDNLIHDKTSKIYNNKKNIEKGIGFPTCISINNTVGHFSPLPSDTTTVKAGDLVKIDLGVHVDGYLAVAAQTFVVGNDEQISSNTVAPLTGRAADAYAAALTAADCALRLLKPGNKNQPITEIIDKVAADYHVKAVQGVLSHQLKRFVIDGEKVIINRSEIEQKVDECEFLLNEVYAIDIVMSTGEGKPKEVDTRQTTVFKRNPAQTYSLKHKMSRVILSEIDKKHSKFPFSLRELDSDGEAKAKFGIAEAVQHQLVQPYPVLYEKDGEFVCQVKFTVLLMPSGSVRITGPPLEIQKHIQSQYKPTNEDVQKTLKISTQNPNAAGAAKKKKKNKKKEGEKKEEAAAPAAQ